MHEFKDVFVSVYRKSDLGNAFETWFNSKMLSKLNYPPDKIKLVVLSIL